MSKNGFHLRVTVKKQAAKQLTLDLVAAFKPLKYIVGFEKKGDNEHMHWHIEFSPEKTIYHHSNAGKTWRSALFKKLGFAGEYNFQRVEKTDEQNILYVMKELDVLQHNLSQEEFEEYQQKTLIINADKKLDVRRKLLARIKDKIKDIRPAVIIKKKSDLDDDDEVHLNKYYPHRLYQISAMIHDIYVDEWDKDPPTMHMKGYTLYIASKISLSFDVKAYYAKLYNEDMEEDPTCAYILKD